MNREEEIIKVIFDLRNYFFDKKLLKQLVGFRGHGWNLVILDTYTELLFWSKITSASWYKYQNQDLLYHYVSRATDFKSSA